MPQRSRHDLTSQEKQQLKEDEVSCEGDIRVGSRISFIVALHAGLSAFIYPNLLSKSVFAVSAVICLYLLKERIRISLATPPSGDDNQELQMVIDEELVVENSQKHKVVVSANPNGYFAQLINRRTTSPISSEVVFELK